MAAKQRTVILPVLLTLAVLAVACGKDESNSKPVPMLPKQRPPAPPLEGVIDTGPTPPLTVSMIEQPDQLAEGPERRAHELVRAGKLREAEKLGAAATPALAFAAGQAHRGTRENIALLQALARVGDERALIPLERLAIFHEGDKVYAATLAAIKDRLAARATTGDRPKVIIRWTRLYAWRPKRLDIERELAKVLAAASIDIVPADTAAIDGVIYADYAEREGSHVSFNLDTGTATGFGLKLDVIGFRKRAVTPIEITGGVSQGEHVSEPDVSGDEELYRHGLRDFRESLAASGVLIAAALR